MEGLKSSLKEKDKQIKELEESLEKASSQLVTLRSRDTWAHNSERDRERDELRSAMEVQFQEQLEMHQRQVAALKAEIVNKERQITQIQQ